MVFTEIYTYDGLIYEIHNSSMLFFAIANIVVYNIVKKKSGSYGTHHRAADNFEIRLKCDRNGNRNQPSMGWNWTSSMQSP